MTSRNRPRCGSSARPRRGPAGARGDAEMAVRHYRDAKEIFRELDAWPEIARCQAGIGWIAVTTGDYGQAQESLAENLRLNQICGQRLGIARGLEAFAALAAARQQPERAARLAGAACRLRESLGHGTGIGPRPGPPLGPRRAGSPPGPTRPGWAHPAGTPAALTGRPARSPAGNTRS